MITGQILFRTEKKPTDFYVGGLALSLSNGVEIDLGWTKSKGVCIDDKGPSKYVIDFALDNVLSRIRSHCDISFATISSEGVVKVIMSLDRDHMMKWQTNMSLAKSWK